MTHLASNSGECSTSSAPFRDERQAILIPLQIALLLFIAATMVFWFAQMHRGSRRSWEEMLACISPECRAACASGTSAEAEVLASIWTMTPRKAFRDAGLLMQMAEYAERNASPYDPARMQHIGSAALRLRIAAAHAMVRRLLRSWPAHD